MDSFVKIDIVAINKQLEYLVKNRQDITLDDIPELIREEFHRYTVGKTVYKKEEKIWIYYHDFLSWVRYKYE